MIPDWMATYLMWMVIVMMHGAIILLGWVAWDMWRNG